MTDDYNYYAIIVGTGVENNDALAGAVAANILTKTLNDVEVLDATMYDHGGVQLDVGTKADDVADQFYSDEASTLNEIDDIEDVQAIGVTQQ